VRKTCCLIILCFFYFGTVAQSVAVINGNPISQKEFVWVYKKHRPGNLKPTMSDLISFLNIYIDFKLKVQDARESGLDKDSTYIAADTLFSGFTKRTIAKNVEKDSVKNDSLRIGMLKADSSKLDTLRKTIIVDLKNSDSSIRYFQAFHHVRIFNDSLQSICDSLYYSGEDSIFKLFQHPVIWSSKSQISGDTIYLYTKNKKAERLYVFENGIVINKTNKEFYNQMIGKTINGYFKNGEIDYMRVRGSKAEWVYYMQDKDSSFIGMNHSTGDVIELYFEKRELKKVKVVNDVHAKVFPMRQLPEEMKYLKNFRKKVDKYLQSLKYIPFTTFIVDGNF